MKKGVNKIEIKKLNCNKYQIVSIMFQPNEFIDKENIIVIDYVPHYRYTGTTYKDKLKNGLSLDYVFDLQNFISSEDDEVYEVMEEDELQESGENLKFADYEENYGFYEQKEFKTIGLTKKGKRLPFKKRPARNMKKTNIKSKGYEYKLFNIEQNLPDLFDESQIEIDYDNVSVECDYNSEYSDNSDDYWSYN